MPIEDDISVDQDGNIRFIGAVDTQYTVLELHRYLQELADDETPGEHDLDITDPIPSVRHTDQMITLVNGYTIDEETAQHLRDGSIRQHNSAGAEEIYSSFHSDGEGIGLKRVRTNIWGERIRFVRMPK